MMWVSVVGIGIDIRIKVEDELDRIIVESAMQMAAKREQRRIRLHPCRTN